MFIPTLLYIESATEVCSIALSKGSEITASVCLDKGNSHIEHLFPFIERALQKSRCRITELDGVVLSAGPGSYTGLRIGASAAKGICYALNIPLIAVPTLQSIVFGAIGNQKETQNLLYCPMIDARRMEVFTALFDKNGKQVSETESKIIDESAFASELQNHIIYFCGNGMPKCKPIIRHANARFIDAPLLASNMLWAALDRFTNRKYEDVAYFEPFYLKEYRAKKSIVKGLV